MRVTIFDTNNHPARFEGGVWLLEEARRWRVRVEGGPCTAALEGLPLAWTADINGFWVDAPFAVGALTLAVQHPEGTTQVPLRIAPAGQKLDPAAWMAMLHDLEAWLGGITTGGEGPRQGAVGHEGARSPFLVEAILPLVVVFEEALAQVLAQPRTRAEDRRRDTPLHQTRAADQETVSWLARHPAAARWVRPENTEAGNGPLPTLPQRSTTDTLDHPANRHLAWLVGRVTKTLEQAGHELLRYNGSELNDNGAWARARANAAFVAAQRVQTIWRRSALRGVAPSAASEGALLVVVDHPLYGRVHRIGRRILQTRFLLGDAAQVATRPSFTLYELWCFYRLPQVLSAAVAHWELRWEWKKVRQLLRHDHTFNGTQAIGTGSRNQQVIVDFNRTFPGYFSRKSDNHPHSLSGERRPDFVVRVNDSERKHWFVLDAKYRAGAANLGSAMASAHIYRDALLWEEYGGKPRKGFLLAPKKSDKVADWFAPPFQNKHGFGMLELRPGADVSSEAMTILRSTMEP